MGCLPWEASRPLRQGSKPGRGGGAGDWGYEQARFGGGARRSNGQRTCQAKGRVLRLTMA